MAQRNVTLIVVIPVGPTCVVDFILDTIESVRAYTTTDRQIILVDDSHTGKGAEVAGRCLPGEVEVVCTQRPRGLGGGLYLSLGQAFGHALRHYRFGVMLRLDTDALVIGREPEQDALALFQRDPRAAIGGRLLTGNVGVQSSLTALTAPAALKDRLRDLCLRPYSLYRMRLIRRYFFLRRLYQRALRGGYVPGNYIFGGTYMMSETFLRRLQQEGLLESWHLGSLDLQEDHIFGLLAPAVGMEMADMQSGDQPFACEWKGLPALPQELLAGGKKVIHSTRIWDTLQEQDIRTIFRLAREQDAALVPHGKV